MRKTLAWTLAGIYVALAAGCSSGHCGNMNGAASTQEPANCTNYVQRLIDCQVIGGTRVSGCDESNPILACVWECMEKATCAELKSWYCQNFFNSYGGCLNECNAMPAQFTCDDGSRIDATHACDGVADCPGGEDEDCTQGYFTCDDGKQIPDSWVCDGLVQCSAGEDENGCPPGPMFTCDDGTTIPESLECNGAVECAGGEDEYDCAKLTCD